LKRDILVLVSVESMHFVDIPLGRKDALHVNFVRLHVQHKLLPLMQRNVKMELVGPLDMIST